MRLTYIALTLALVAHIQAGAAGMESADLADAAHALILGGQQRHMDAIAAIVEKADVEQRMRVAKYIQRLYIEGQPNQQGWAPTLVPMLGLSGDDQDAANLAARGLGALDGDGIDEVVASVMAGGNADTLDYLIQGFESKLGRGLGTAGTIGRLDTIAGAADKKNARAAEKLAKKWRKKV
ncbi:MAG: hypothetical protein GY898_00760 [Proteobacteria bacterium]|nr:hypothetical protein [Pseudomonadota bacterium]